MPPSSYYKCNVKITATGHNERVQTNEGNSATAPPTTESTSTAAATTAGRLSATGPKPVRVVFSCVLYCRSQEHQAAADCRRRRPTVAELSCARYLHSDRRLPRSSSYRASPCRRYRGCRRRCRRA